MSNLRATRMKGWFEFTREVCPVCGKTGGCLVNTKGDTIVCIRVTSDIVFSKTFQSWVHHLTDKKQVSVQATNSVNEREKAPSWTLNNFFRIFNSKLVLSTEHVAHLNSVRGMSNNEVQARQYKSFPKYAGELAANTINAIPNFDKLNLGIPGFYKKNDKWMVQGGEGILIPYRNEENEILGYQIRVDEPKNFVTIKSDSNEAVPFKAIIKKQPNLVSIINEDGEILFEKELQIKEEIKVNSVNNSDKASYVRLNAGLRYYWLSSANKEQGCGAGDPAPYHVAVPTKHLMQWETMDVGENKVLKTDSAWITEGALKADIAIEQLSHAYGNKLSEIGDVALAVPGVSSWRILIPVIKKMGIKNINLAFDIDAMENSQVAQQLKSCIVELKGMGISVNIAYWNPSDGKGIDDLLLQKKIPMLKKL